MDISLILRAAGVGLIVSVICQILSKSGRDEQAMLVSVAGAVIVFLMLVRELGTHHRHDKKDIFAVNAVIQICGVAVISAVLASVLKRMKPGAGVPVSLAAVIFLSLLAVKKYGGAVQTVCSLAEKSGMSGCAELMIRSLGIGITVKIASDVCRDCGEEGIAGAVELAGKLGILLLCIPQAVGLLDAAAGLMS